MRDACFSMNVRMDQHSENVPQFALKKSVMLVTNAEEYSHHLNLVPSFCFSTAPALLNLLNLAISPCAH